jgi:F-type H+-transporting ATPase subunit b
MFFAPGLLRRSAPLLVCAFLAVSQAFAQETPQETVILDAVTRWKIINFALFLIGLGYLLWKYAPRFFNARSAEIQKSIQDATGLRMQAELRYSEIDRKMATLAEEIKKMREQQAVEVQRARERVLHETQLEISHIQSNVQNEIEALRHEAANRVRRHTAQLALVSAEQRLRERFAQEDPRPLIDDFIRLVERGKN